MYVYSRRTESISGANLITIRMRNPAGGIWKFNLYPNIKGHTEADIWVMNRGFLNENTYFIVSDPEDTIVNPGNLVEAITVTAYDYRDNTIYLKTAGVITGTDYLNRICGTGSQYDRSVTYRNG